MREDEDDSETKSKSTKGEPRRESKTLARRKSTSKEDLENEEAEVFGS